jgi:uncharacterized protein VirK/YbjX
VLETITKTKNESMYIALLPNTIISYKYTHRKILYIKDIIKIETKLKLGSFLNNLINSNISIGVSRKIEVIPKGLIKTISIIIPTIKR